ncbi:ParM/StbA family protein [Paenibacillus bovis]|nr:ParM/StbA family protein [Paenibacillus bovis]
MKDRVVLDLGNVKAKSEINGQNLPNVPTAIKRVNQIPKVSDDNISTRIDQIFEELTVEISSNAINRGGLFYIGQRALMHPPAIAMPIKNGKKYESDVTIITALGIVAADAVTRAFKEMGSLPDSIQCEDVLASMIPATQAEPINCKHLEDRFLNDGHAHTVIVYVGYQKVLVSITFTDVKVTMEGLPAIYAIQKHQSEMLAAIKALYTETDSDDDKTKEWKKKVASYTIEDIVSQRSLSTDIGHGTSDLPVMNGLKPDRERSEGIEAGVGHAEESAARALNEELSNNLTVTRHQFDDILLDKLHPHHATAVELMETANYEQSEFIYNKFTERYQEIGGNAGLFPVYGGGSITFKKDLLPMMMKYATSVRAILLWVPEELAPYMNRDGLEVLASTIFFSKFEPSLEVLKQDLKNSKGTTQEGEG